MKTCQYCGSTIEDDLKFCTNCGAALPVEPSAEPQVVEATVIEDQPYQQPMYQQPNPTQSPGASQQVYDSGSFGWAVLGFFIPIVGIILYFVWMNERPGSAKMSLYGALASIALALLFRLGVGCTFLF